MAKGKNKGDQLVTKRMLDEAVEGGLKLNLQIPPPELNLKI